MTKKQVGEGKVFLAYTSILLFCNDFSHIRLVLPGSRGHACADKPSAEVPNGPPGMLKGPE